MLAKLIFSCGGFAEGAMLRMRISIFPAGEARAAESSRGEEVRDTIGEGWTGEPGVKPVLHRGAVLS